MSPLRYYSTLAIRLGLTTKKQQENKIHPQ